MDIATQVRFLEKKGIKLKNIKNKKITIVGLGGLGSHLANALIRIGFKNLKLLDGDVVEASNLSRQILFTKNDIGEYKTDVTKRFLQEVNPSARIEAYETYLEKSNTNLLRDSDIVLDGTDNIRTRELINSYCFQNETPWVQAAAIGSRGTVTPFIPGKTPCYRCLNGDSLDNESLVTCSGEGVLITTLMTVVSKQLVKAIKILSNQEVDHSSYTFDHWEDNSSSIDFTLFKDPQCVVCKKDKFDPHKEGVVKSTLQIICDGYVKDVRIKDTLSIEQNIPPSYVMTNNNKLFTEYSCGEKRIVVYHNQKVSFYNFQKEEILMMSA